MPRSRDVGSEDDEEEKEKEKEKEKDEAIEELSVPEDQAAERPESPATGAGAEDVGGGSPTWFRGAAQCCDSVS
jgi:hypothetical protein